MTENAGVITSTASLRYAPLTSFARPYDAEAFRQPPIFSARSRAAVSRPSSPRLRPRRLTADQVLFISGDEGDGCYRVDDGLLKVSVVAPAGGERILAVLGAWRAGG